MADVGSFSIRFSKGLSDINLHFADRNGQHRVRTIMTLALISALGFMTYFWVGTTEVALGLLSWVEEARACPLALGVALFLFWTALFFTAVPLGSATVMTAGFFFGPLTGFLQAASQLTSSIILYRLYPKPTESILTEPRTMTLARDHPISIVAAIRLVPILPSAISVIAYRELCISLRHMVIGTLYVGWMRPVSLAWIGSHLPDIQALLERLP